MNLPPPEHLESVFRVLERAHAANDPDAPAALEMVMAMSNALRVLAIAVRSLDQDVFADALHVAVERVASDLDQVSPTAH